MDAIILNDGSERMRYRDPAIPLYIVHSNLRSLPNMAFLCHWHEDVELLLPLRGHLTYNVNGQSIQVEEGNAIFVNARQLHASQSTDGSDCQYLCVCFRPELLCANEAIRDRFVLPILANPELPWVLLRPEDERHAPLLDLLKALPEEPAQAMAALGQLHLFWQKLHEAFGDAATSDEPIPVEPLRRMLTFIRTHYQERITIREIAQAGGVCRSKGCQIFRQYLQTTPNEYLNSFRLEMSAEMLLSTTRSITEIALECGFSSSSYFSQLFTARKGCPPTMYRQAPLTQKA